MPTNVFSDKDLANLAKLFNDRATKQTTADSTVQELNSKNILDETKSVKNVLGYIEDVLIESESNAIGRSKVDKNEKSRSWNTLGIIANLSKKEFQKSKKRDGTDKYIADAFVKKKFLERAGEAFGGIWKGIKKLGSGGILKGLLQLFLMGGLMKILLPFFMNGIRMIVDMLITLIPPLLTYVWDAFWKIIVPGFKDIGRKIGLALFPQKVAKKGEKLSTFDKIGNKIKEFLASLMEKLGFLAPILYVINKALGLFGSSIFDVIGKVGGLIWKIKDLPWGEIGEGLKKFGSKLFDIGKFLGGNLIKGLSFLGKGMVSLAQSAWAACAGLFAEIVANWALIWPILAVVAAVALVVAGFVLLYMYAEQVSDWFDGLWDKFKKLNKWAKIGIVILALLFFPITAIFLLIWGFAKLFKSIKQIGFKETMKLIWEAIKQAASDSWDSVVNWFKAKGRKFADWFTEFLDDIIESFRSVGDWFTGFASYGPLDWFTMNTSDRASANKQIKASREAGIDFGLVKRLEEGDASAGKDVAAIADETIKKRTQAVADEYRRLGGVEDVTSDKNKDNANAMVKMFEGYKTKSSKERG